MSARPLLPSIAVVALVSSSAFAAPPAGFDALDTPEGAIAIDPPYLPAAGLDQPRSPQLLGDKVMFINFDGGQMNGCFNDDPHDNCSSIWDGMVSAYTGDAAKRATVIQIVRKRTEDFGITVTDARPASGDYDMEMVGDWVGVDDPGFAGVAPSIDCFDNDGGETSFTLEASGTSDGIAEIILQEIAHTWGLEHVDEQGDLLYPTTQGQNKAFQDQCNKIVSNTDLDPSNGFCNSMHTQFCSSGFQNSYQELLTLFGPAIPDTDPPLVEILAPTEGETIEGGDLTMVLRLEDNLVPVIINATIRVESSALPMPIEEDGAYAGPAPGLEFPINGLPDGEYTISIDATDEYDNPASDSVTFTVVGNPAMGDESGGEGGDSATSAADDGAGTSAGEAGEEDGSGGDDEGDDEGDDDGSDGSAGATAGNDTTDRGCACTQGDASPFALGFLGLFVLGARRRRSC